MHIQNRDFCKAHGLALMLGSIGVIMGCQRLDREWLNSEAAKKEWRVYLGDQASSHYSALNQINQENVKNLQIAWRYHTGDLPAGEYGEIQCNPIVVNGVLYGSSPRTKIFALNAGTGEEVW